MTKDIFWNGFKELRSVWMELKDNFKLKRYLGAFFVYSMSLQTVLLVAAYFGEEEIAWGSTSEKTTGLIISILLIQIVGILGAILTSRSSERFGNIPTLVSVNIIWAGLCVYCLLYTSPSPRDISGSRMPSSA